MATITQYQTIIQWIVIIVSALHLVQISGYLTLATGDNPEPEGRRVMCTKLKKLHPTILADLIKEGKIKPNERQKEKMLPTRKSKTKSKSGTPDGAATPGYFDMFPSYDSMLRVIYHITGRGEPDDEEEDFPYELEKGLIIVKVERGEILTTGENENEFVADAVLTSITLGELANNHFQVAHITRSRRRDVEPTTTLKPISFVEFTAVPAIGYSERNTVFKASDPETAEMTLETLLHSNSHCNDPNFVTELILTGYQKYTVHVVAHIRKKGAQNKASSAPHDHEGYFHRGVTLNKITETFLETTTGIEIHLGGEHDARDGTAVLSTFLKGPHYQASNNQLTITLEEPERAHD